MYEVKAIFEYQMTRDIVLENIETGTIITCFDDSELVGTVSFDFMKIGGQYDCKIRLFGDLVEHSTMESLSCQVTGKISIGKKSFYEVLVANDTYYLADIFEIKSKQVNFICTRFDLLEVYVVHGDLLG